MEMKKNWTFFRLITALIALATGVGAGFAVLVSVWFGTAAVTAGAFAEGYFLLRYNAVEYLADETQITIRGGVFVKREIILPRENILWTTKVKIGSAGLFAVLHTIGGNAVVFADVSF